MSGNSFVVNAREVPWTERAGQRRSSSFEGETRFAQLGISVNVLEPGSPSGMYHSEQAEENFLIISGECVLLIEGEEHSLKAWDFVHCPPGTEHVFVGAGSGPCVYVAVGARPGNEQLHYPAAEFAQRYGAAVPETTDSPGEAYAPYPRAVQAYRDGDLPAL